LIDCILRDVSFAYPGGGKKTNALTGINLDIKAGQLVVVVGVNGSGKSTLTRLLARLYDPTSGEILIDGRPSTEYRMAGLHCATALLSQDSEIYPLTLAENIGLGYPEHSSDLEMIKEAASEAGAAEFIEELENGYQTMLETFDRSFHMNLDGDRKHPLWVMSDKLAKKSDVSGGQRQRIIAYVLVVVTSFCALAYLTTVLGHSCDLNRAMSTPLSSMRRLQLWMPTLNYNCSSG
jgi:ABC-type multidrug transport system fused ATPase/permease subunit